MSQKEMNYSKWLTSDQVCQLLGISKRTLQNYRGNKIIPFSQISRKIYYKAEDINNYLERHYIKAAYQLNKEGGEL